jgi:hypothetical protein
MHIVGQGISNLYDHGIKSRRLNIVFAKAEAVLGNDVAGHCTYMALIHASLGNKS